jgi:ribonucleoside-diphosphate reductase subunit M1
VERPQHLFMRVAIGIHGEDMERVKETYDSLSLKYYTHATPTLFHAGTQRPQMSSCFLLDGSVDSVEGIFKSITNCALISKWAGGIGVHMSGIRGNGSYIRKTSGKSTGIMPMLKVYNDTARYINQSGARPGSFAMYLEPWHLDVFTFLDAKKNHGQDEERARDLFYALWIPDIFMERVKSNGYWTLMCPDVYPGLTEVYGEAFTKLYTKYENEMTTDDVNKYRIQARDLWKAIISSQVETGTPYMLYKNACNKKSNQKNLGVIKSSNLCAEIIQYSTSSNPNGDPEAAVCNLASLCLPKILEEPDLSYFHTETVTVFSKSECGWCTLAKGTLKKLGIEFIVKNLDDEEERTAAFEFYNVSTLPQIFVGDRRIGGYNDLWHIVKPTINYTLLGKMTRAVTYNLNKIIDKNFYPIPSTETSNKRHRPIGIGIQGLADLFIRLRLPFTSPEAKRINCAIFETMYYHSLSESNNIARASGPYETFHGSPLSEGKFQFDLWDSVKLSGMYDWEALRTDIMATGVRNSLLIAVMPTASTSQIMGNNECAEPYTSNVYKRRTLAGEFTVVNEHLMEDLMSMGMWNEDTRSRLMYLRGSVQDLPNLPSHLKEIYKTTWEISQKECINMAADRGRFVCQSQSFNLWFEKPDFKTLTNAHMYGWSSGLKTGSYYIRSKPRLNSQRFTMDPEKEKQYEAEKHKKNSERKKGYEEECLSCGA